MLVTIPDLVIAWAQVERQIEQMCQFVKQEAEEKANEIKISAEEVRIFEGAPNAQKHYLRRA